MGDFHRTIPQGQHLSPNAIALFKRVSPTRRLLRRQWLQAASVNLRVFLAGSAADPVFLRF